MPQSNVFPAERYSASSTGGSGVFAYPQQEKECHNDQVSHNAHSLGGGLCILMSDPLDCGARESLLGLWCRVFFLPLYSLFGEARV